MTTRRIVTPERHIGLSTDTKPTHQRAGATFYERDSGQLFITYDGTNWVPKSDTANWMFGAPTLFAQGNGSAVWEKGVRTSTLATDQKSTTGWLAKLIGGEQTGYDDAGSLWIPVNELLLPDLLSASWSYNMSASEVFGCQIQIWIHDPDDPSERADIIQSGSATSLGKGSGWNSHVFDLDDVCLFWYGEVTGSTLSGGPGNLHSLQEFIDDATFKDWTIYRISLNNGFYNTGTFGTTYVADVKVNGQVIPLKPSTEEQLFNKMPILKEIRTAVDIGSTDCTTFAVGDIMGNDDCCTTSAVAWTFANVARNLGGYGRIIGATLVSDMEDLAIQYDLLLFNAEPTNTLLSNSINDNPQKEDISLFIGEIIFPQSTARGSDVATYTQATPASTSTNLPMPFKCVASDDNIYGVLVTRTGYDHTDNDTIEITLLVEQW